MIKQLYTLNIGLFVKSAMLAIFSILLVACGNESSTNEQATSSDTMANAVSEFSDVLEEAGPEKMTAEMLEVPSMSIEEAGFLNRDMVMGDPNAPVEIIEYASLTCNHCATFHNNVLPRLKEEYIDTGKAKIVMRSFMLNPIDMQATTISRCMTEKRYAPFMNMLFSRQMEWYNVGKYQELAANNDPQSANQLFVDGTMEEVHKYARQAGLNKAKIDACLANEDISKYLFEVQQYAVEQYKVNATPTIIVNGNKAGNDFNSISRLIEAELD